MATKTAKPTVKKSAKSAAKAAPPAAKSATAVTRKGKAAVTKTATTPAKSGGKSGGKGGATSVKDVKSVKGGGNGAATVAAKGVARAAVKAPARSATKTTVKAAAAATKTTAAKTPASASSSAAARKTVTKAATKSVAKAAAKSPVKAATRAAPATAVKGVKATAAKGAAKGAVKGAVKASGKQAPKQAPKLQSAGNKKVATKPATKPAKKTASAPAPGSPVSLKGLRVSGAKAARIAEIVAESYANRPAPEVTPPVTKAAKAGDAGPGHEPGSALDAAHKAAAILFAKKAEDVVLMDLRELSTVADYYLIATCTNEPQMRAILNTLQRSLSREGIKSLRSEYMPGVRWAVVDYGDLIVHLFEKQTRGFYSLERLWADAPSTTLNAADYALPVDDHETDMDEDGDL